MVLVVVFSLMMFDVDVVVNVCCDVRVTFDVDVEKFAAKAGATIRYDDDDVEDLDVLLKSV